MAARKKSDDNALSGSFAGKVKAKAKTKYQQGAGVNTRPGTKATRYGQNVGATVKSTPKNPRGKTVAERYPRDVAKPVWPKNKTLPKGL